MYTLLSHVTIAFTPPGISLRTQALLCVCSTIRLVTALFIEKEQGDSYSFCMSLFFCSASGLAYYFAKYVSPVKTTKTPEPCITTASSVIGLISILLPLALVINLASLKQYRNLEWLEGLCLWSHYAEPFCLIPQITVHQRYYQSIGGIGTFLLFLGTYRLMILSDAFAYPNAYDTTFFFVSMIQALLAVGGILAPFRNAVYRFCRDVANATVPRLIPISLIILTVIGVFMFPTLVLEACFLLALVILGFYFRYSLSQSRERPQRNLALEAEELGDQPEKVAAAVTESVEADDELSQVELIGEQQGKVAAAEVESEEVDGELSEVELEAEPATTGDEDQEQGIFGREGAEDDKEPQPDLLSQKELRMLAIVLFSSIAIVGVCLVRGSAILDSSGMHAICLPVLLVGMCLVTTYGRRGEQDQCFPQVVQIFWHPFWLLVLLAMIFASLDGLVNLPPGSFVLMLVILFSPLSFVAYFLIADEEARTRLICCQGVTESEPFPSLGGALTEMTIPLLNDDHRNELLPQVTRSDPSIQIV
jgi:hypothetical protein